GPELARVWLDLLQRPTHELRDRHAVARPALEVHHRRLEPVAGGEPLDLDRPEARVQTDVPPDVRVVRDAAGLLELADDLGVVGVVAEARRGTRAREGREDHLPARREPGRLAAPEGRAGRERE